MHEIEEILKSKGIAPTPVRSLVYNCILKSKTPISLTEIEDILESVDRSSISRSLTLFKKHHLLHSFNDGSGSVKYEICHAHDHSLFDDSHVHFRCEKCGLTKCLTDLSIPEVSLPDGYLSHEVSYIIRGICNECNSDN